MDSGDGFRGQCMDLGIPGTVYGFRLRGFRDPQYHSQTKDEIAIVEVCGTAALGGAICSTPALGCE
jgi:hypothetical protein